MYLFEFSGVHGHFEGSNPFAECDNRCVPTLCTLVGKFK